MRTNTKIDELYQELEKERELQFKLYSQLGENAILNEEWLRSEIKCKSIDEQLEMLYEEEYACK
jgi:hypothetical protein